MMKITLTGEIEVCEGCAQAKEKAKLVKKYVDCINIQCYHSISNAWPTQKLVQMVERFQKGSGIPRPRLNIGLPIYGMANTRKHPKAGSIAYKEMINKGADPKKNKWYDPKKKCDMFYRGIPLIKEKTRWAKQNNYGGVFTWEISMDMPYAHKASILRAIDEVVEEKHKALKPKRLK